MNLEVKHHDEGVLPFMNLEGVSQAEGVSPAWYNLRGLPTQGAPALFAKKKKKWKKMNN